MTFDKNPFPEGDADRHELWEMLVRRDIDAFLAQDWSMVEVDFVAASFFGMHAHFLNDADSWRLQFPRLEIYRDEWLRQAHEGQKTEYAEDVEAGIHRATSLTEIEITGERAIAHKKFNGEIKLSNGGVDRLNWQTLYFLRKIDGAWKLTGFVGYLPYPMPKQG